MKVIRSNNSYRFDKSDRFSIKANNFLMMMEARGMSLHSVRAYAYDLLALSRWPGTLDKTWSKKFSQKELQNWMLDCQKKKLRPRSINRRLACVRVFYRYCFGQHIPHSPGVLYPRAHFRGTRRDSRPGLFFPARRSLMELKVKVPQNVVNPLRPEDVDGFLSGIRRYRDLAIVLTMLLCGLRSQEIIFMRFNDIDFEQA